MSNTEVISWSAFFAKDVEVKPTGIKWERVKKLVKNSIVPVTLIALALPLSGLIDISSVHALASESPNIINVHGIHDVQTVTQSVPIASTPDNSGWDMLTHKVLWLTDYLMDGVIIYSGISWMFGNRTKAIELMFSAGVGYIIVRHHEDIKHFFALL